MSKKILRLPEVRERLGVGRTTLYERFVRTGRLRPVQIGPRAIGFVECDVDGIIDELVAQRDATGGTLHEEQTFRLIQGRWSSRPPLGLALCELDWQQNQTSNETRNATEK